MIQYLLFDPSKILNINDITKRIGNFFKLPILLFYTITYPELALNDIATQHVIKFLTLYVYKLSTGLEMGNFLIGSHKVYLAL